MLCISVLMGDLLFVVVVVVVVSGYMNKGLVVLLLGNLLVLWLMFFLSCVEGKEVYVKVGLVELLLGFKEENWWRYDLCFF